MDGMNNAYGRAREAAALESEVQRLRARVAEQAAEIAELKAYREVDCKAFNDAIDEAKALRARVAEQDAEIARLRALVSPEEARDE